MCRSIKTLRPPYVEEATSDDVTAAALQYVRKIAGMRKPSAVNQQAFDEAVADIAAATEHLLGHLQVRPAPAARELSPAGNASRDLSRK